MTAAWHACLHRPAPRSLHNAFPAARRAERTAALCSRVLASEVRARLAVVESRGSRAELPLGFVPSLDAEGVTENHPSCAPDPPARRYTSTNRCNNRCLDCPQGEQPPEGQPTAQAMRGRGLSRPPGKGSAVVIH